MLWCVMPEEGKNEGQYLVWIVPLLSKQYRNTMCTYLLIHQPPNTGHWLLVEDECYPYKASTHTRQTNKAENLMWCEKNALGNNLCGFVFMLFCQTCLEDIKSMHLNTVLLISSTPNVRAKGSNKKEGGGQEDGRVRATGRVQKWNSCLS